MVSARGGCKTRRKVQAMNTLPRSRGISETTERQMRSWALGLQSRQRLAESRAEQVESLIHPYLVISRETGVDAPAIAEALASKIGWKFMDQALLNSLAEDHHWSPVALEYVDEQTASWFHETFGRWLDQKLVSQTDYVRQLAKAVLVAAQHESMIFIGRGVHFMLPRELGLAVRLVEPRKSRIARVAAQRGCKEREAERHVDDTDRGRADFVRRYFHHDVADPSLYDLVINLAHVSREDAVELIATACQRRWPRACPE
jgi:cytidylate kinase